MINKDEFNSKRKPRVSKILVRGADGSIGNSIYIRYID